MEHDVLLEMKNISKEFPGVKALDNVSLTVRRGTVHALMGENGAGRLVSVRFTTFLPERESAVLLQMKEMTKIWNVFLNFRKKILPDFVL